MMSLIAAPLRSLLMNREVLLRTTAAEVRQKHAGSVAGMFWLILSPLLLMTIYSVIYLLIFKVRPSDMNEYEYVLYILAGLIPFIGFVDALNVGASSLVLNKAILLNTVFPSELVPLRAVLASQGSTATGLILVLLVAVALGKLSWTVLFVPVVWMFQTMFVMGLVWILSLATLVLRDIQQALAFITMALLVMSPIAYTPEMVPPALKMIVYLNPLSYFVIGFHELVVFHRLPAASIIVAIVGFGLISFCFGFWVFQRAKKVFFDYV